jgi:flagellar biosynthesis chaperone FliJ
MNKARRTALSKIQDLLTTAVEELESLKAEEEEYRDNIPENMQGGEKYEQAESAVDALDTAIDSLREASDSIDEAVGT